jgi:hypothetical protein
MAQRSKLGHKILGKGRKFVMDIKFKANQETLRLCVKNVSPLVGEHAKRPELQNLLFNIRRGYTEETKARVWVSATDGIACTMQCFDVFDYEGPIASAFLVPSFKVPKEKDVGVVEFRINLEEDLLYLDYGETKTILSLYRNRDNSKLFQWQSCAPDPTTTPKFTITCNKTELENCPVRFNFYGETSPCMIMSAKEDMEPVSLILPIRVNGGRQTVATMQALKDIK